MSVQPVITQDPAAKALAPSAYQSSLPAPPPAAGETFANHDPKFREGYTAGYKDGGHGTQNVPLSTEHDKAHHSRKHKSHKHYKGHQYQDKYAEGYFQGQRDSKHGYTGGAPFKPHPQQLPVGGAPYSGNLPTYQPGVGYVAPSTTQTRDPVTHGSTTYSPSAGAPRTYDQYVRDQQFENVNGIYSMLKGFGDGSLPTNKQLNEFIDKTSIAIERERSKQGGIDQATATALDHLQELLGALKLIINEKNSGDKLQQFFSHAKEVSGHVANHPETQGAGQSVKGKASEIMHNPNLKDQGTQMLTSLRRFVGLMVTSPQFRGLMTDVMKFVQETFLQKTGDGTSILEPLKQGIQGNIPLSQGIKEAAGTVKAGAGQLAGEAQNSNVSIRPELRESIIQRAKQLIRDIAAHPEYRSAVEGMFSVIETLRDELKDAGDKTGSHATGVFQDPTTRSHFDEMVALAKQILEEFAQGRSLGPMTEYFKRFASQLKHDTRLSEWFHECKVFLTDTLNYPNLLDDQAHMQKGNQLIDNGRALFYENKNSEEFRTLIAEIREYMNAIATDPSSNKFVNALRNVGGDLVLTDGNGKQQINAPLLNNLKGLAVPILLEQIRNVPLPKIDGQNEKFAYSLDNIVISAEDVLPDQVKIRTSNDMDVSLMGLGVNRHITDFYISLGHILLNLKQVKFWFKQLTGLKIEEEGLVDVSVYGKGANITIHIESDSWDTERVFYTRDVRCFIDKLRINVYDSKHSKLENFVLKMFKKTIKRRVERKIEEELLFRLRNFDQKLDDLWETATSYVKSAGSTGMGGITSVITGAPSAIKSAVTGAASAVGHAKDSAHHSLEQAKQNHPGPQQQQPQVVHQQVAVPVQQVAVPVQQVPVTQYAAGGNFANTNYAPPGTVAPGGYVAPGQVVYREVATQVVDASGHPVVAPVTHQPHPQQ